MTIFHRLGRALRFLREKRGKSQKLVAAAAGVTPPMLSAYENERTCPEVDTLDKILHFGLEASLADLYWALDVVNDRVPQGVPRPAAPGPGDAPALLAAGRLDRRHLAAGDQASGPFPPALEEGYLQIVQGLLQISRVVYDSVVQQGTGRDLGSD